MARKKQTPKQTDAKPYRHPESDSPMRPDVGTQAQFRKKKEPKTYRYDSSLSPALDWDGQNAARERGETLIGEILDATVTADGGILRSAGGGIEVDPSASRSPSSRQS